MRHVPLRNHSFTSPPLKSRIDIFGYSADAEEAAVGDVMIGVTGVTGVIDRTEAVDEDNEDAVLVFLTF